MTERERLTLWAAKAYPTVREAAHLAGLYMLTARRVLTVWTAGILYLLVVLVRKRLPVAACAAYLGSVIRWGFMAERAWVPCRKDSTAALNPENPPLQPVPAFRTLPEPGDVRLLTDRRVMVLQRKIVGVVFQKTFGLHPGKKELKVFCRFSSILWLWVNMARAAGSAENPDDQTHRNRLVFPVFMKALEMHLAWLQKADGGGDRKLRHREKKLRRFSKIGRHGEITGCLYPEIVTFRKLRLEGEVKAALHASLRLKIRTAGEAGMLSCGMAAVSLAAVQGRNGKDGSMKALRSLRAVLNLF